MIKFLHAADLHLDSPFSLLPPAQAAIRRQEQRRLLDDLAELCNSEQCDLLLLAGDLFDAEGAYQDTIDALSRAFGACDAQVFISPGNHDFYAPGSPYCGSWPENVHIFRSEKPEPYVLPALGVTVWGAAFQSASAPAMLEGFRVDDTDILNVMVLHGDTDAASAYNPITRAQIESSGLDYLALGHIHAASGRGQSGKTVYAYPGCTMGRGFDELGEKGVYLGVLSQQGCELTFRALPGRKYEILTVTVGDDALADIEAALPPDTQQDIYRIFLTGACETPDIRALHAALEARFFTLVLRDKTTRRRDIWAECGEDTLKGLFLQNLRNVREENPAQYDLAAAIGLAVMEGREVPEP